MTSDTGSQPAFQSRVDAVFGALQTATNSDGSAWSLRDEQVAMQTHKSYLLGGCMGFVGPSASQPAIFSTSYFGVQVSRTGKDTDYSSEEEEEAKRADAENGSLLDLQVSIEGDLAQGYSCLNSPLR